MKKHQGVSNEDVFHQYGSSWIFQHVALIYNIFQIFFPWKGKSLLWTKLWVIKCNRALLHGSKCDVSCEWDGGGDVSFMMNAGSISHSLWGSPIVHVWQIYDRLFSRRNPDPSPGLVESSFPPWPIHWCRANGNCTTFEAIGEMATALSAGHWASPEIS